MPLDNTPLGLKLPHPDNDPYSVDVPRLRDALTLVDTLLTALRTDVDAEPGARDQAIAVAVASLVSSSPTTLDTLNELAAALGDDPDFAATIASELGLKATKAELQAAVDTLNAALATKADAAALATKADAAAVQAADDLRVHNDFYGGL